MPLSKTRSSAYLFLLLNTILWGSSTPIIKYTLQFTSPTVFLLYRYIIATAIFLPIFLVYRHKTHHRINHLHTILLAFLGGPLCLLLSFYGISKTSAIEASIISSSGPLFTVLMSVVFLKEIINKKEWKGLTLALLGAVIVVFEPIITGYNHVILSLEGNLLIILSNVIWTFFLIFSKKIKVNPIYLTFYSFIISIPFFLFFSLNQQLSFQLTPLAVPGILYMAIGGSVIGFWAYQEGQRRIEASEAVVFTYLNPIFAIPLSILWLKETISPVTVAATVLIIVGVYISEKR